MCVETMRMRTREYRRDTNHMKKPSMTETKNQAHTSLGYARRYVFWERDI